MSMLRKLGPEKPSPLVTVREARAGMRLYIYCRRCDAGRPIAGADLPERLKRFTLGELWITGRFRCATCRDPATSVAVACDWDMTRRERWALDEPYAAERLRRYWRWTMPR